MNAATWSPVRTALAAVAGLWLAAAVPAGAEEVLRDESSGLEYLEVITGGAAATDPLPVVVAMHGLGDNPASFRLLLDDLPARARVVFPRAPMPHGTNGFSWFDFRTDDEDGAGELGAGIRAASDRVARLMVALAARHNGPARSVICGFSQGGMLSFALAASHPELVSTAIPLAGYLPTALWPRERPKTRPLPTVTAIHGEADHLIPVDSARWSIEALRGNGYDVALKTFPGVAHALSPPMRAALEALVVVAVNELTQPGTVLPGPPAPPAPEPSVPAH